MGAAGARDPAGLGRALVGHAGGPRLLGSDCPSPASAAIGARAIRRGECGSHSAHDGPLAATVRGRARGGALLEGEEDIGMKFGQTRDGVEVPAKLQLRTPSGAGPTTRT